MSEDGSYFLSSSSGTGGIGAELSVSNYVGVDRESTKAKTLFIIWYIKGYVTSKAAGRLIMLNMF